MSAALVAAFVLGVALAFANGANDVSKGIATLVGSRTGEYGRAALWGSVWTGAGCLLAAGLAGAMVETFGRALVTPGVAPSLPASLAVILGAASWVLLATRAGIPVSTTHAIAGAIVGAGAAAYGFHALMWTSLAGGIAIPLLLSPVVAFTASLSLLRVLGGGAAPAAPAADCVCANYEPSAAAFTATTPGTHAQAVLPMDGRLRFTVATKDACPPAGTGVFRLTLDSLHWATSGLTSLARALNDAPKIAAILLAAGALGGNTPPHAPTAFLAVALGMVAGSLLYGQRVTKVLAEKITPLDPRQGSLANFVTAALVISGALFGLPMSTTHVSSTAILGVGMGRKARSVAWKTVRTIALAWIVTLPGAALLAAVAYGLLLALQGGTA